MSEDEDELLVDEGEELHRQVLKRHISNGRVTSHLFHLREMDQGRLSVDRGAIHTKEQAFAHFEEQYKGRSQGLATVTVGQADELEIPSRVHPHRQKNPAHAYLDLRHLDPEGAEFAADDLLRLAMANGIWSPDNDDV